MNARGLALGASLLLATTAHCATPEEEGGHPDEAPVEDAPLDLQVDAVEVVHGALRLRATMTGGSPDVSVALGGGCDAREVGGGLSTATALSWTLGETDVADAIDCGLLVRATIRVGGRTATRVAALGVTVGLTAATEEVADSEEAPDPAPATVTPGRDLARALLLKRQVVVDGDAFDVAIEVGGVPLS
jgi:hypothetical protein